jgi:hypothetical protein
MGDVEKWYLGTFIVLFFSIFFAVVPKSRDFSRIVLRFFYLLVWAVITQFIVTYTVDFAVLLDGDINVPSHKIMVYSMVFFPILFVYNRRLMIFSFLFGFFAYYYKHTFSGDMITMVFYQGFFASLLFSTNWIYEPTSLGLWGDLRTFKKYLKGKKR